MKVISKQLMCHLPSSICLNTMCRMLIPRDEHAFSTHIMYMLVTLPYPFFLVSRRVTNTILISGRILSPRKLITPGSPLRPTTNWHRQGLRWPHQNRHWVKGVNVSSSPCTSTDQVRAQPRGGLLGGGYIIPERGPTGRPTKLGPFSNNTRVSFIEGSYEGCWLPNTCSLPCVGMSRPAVLHWFVSMRGRKPLVGITNVQGIWVRESMTALESKAENWRQCTFKRALLMFIFWVI